jgi:hypothetical protein
VRDEHYRSSCRKPKPREHFELRPLEFFRSHSVSRAKPSLQVRGRARGTGKKQATSSNGYAARGTRDGRQLFGRQFLNFHPDTIRDTEQQNCSILNRSPSGPLLPLAQHQKLEGSTPMLSRLKLVPIEEGSFTTPISLTHTLRIDLLFGLRYF